MTEKNGQKWQNVAKTSSKNCKVTKNLCQKLLKLQKLLRKCHQNQGKLEKLSKNAKNKYRSNCLKSLKNVWKWYENLIKTVVQKLREDS